MLLERELTERVIGLAIEVHPRVKPGDQTGPDMLESVYEGYLCYGLEQAGVAFERQAGIPVTYKRVQFDEGFRADIPVDRQLIPGALETDTRTEAAPSCRRRPASTILLLAQRKVVDTGLRRHDALGVVRASIFSRAGIRRLRRYRGRKANRHAHRQ